MKKLVLIAGMVFIAITVVPNKLMAQGKTDTSKTAFSLKEAQDFAMQNSATVKNANLDIELAKKKIWETKAIGLPQVSSKFSFSYMLTVPKLIDQFNSFSSIGTNFGEIYGMLGALGYQTHNPYVLHKMDSLQNLNTETAPAKKVTTDDMRWGLTYDITASQLLFSSSYLLGIKTMKLFKEISESAASKSQNDVMENVTNAYYMVLIAQENKNTLDSIHKTTEKTYANINGLYQQGMVEETDVDQLKLTLSTILNTIDMLNRQTEVAKKLLKFQMGIDINKPITLTDKLDLLISGKNLNDLLSKEFNAQNYIDYKILDEQVKLAKINVSYQKTTLLPDLVAFYQHEENFNKNSFSFTPPNMLGASLNIPIFGSGQKLSRISQAKISLAKTVNSKQMVEAGLITSFSEAKSSFMSALNKYKINKESIQLADKIYNRNVIKYKEGLVGSLDLAQSQNQYLQAQSNYFTALLELTTSVTKLEKMLK